MFHKPDSPTCSRCILYILHNHFVYFQPFPWTHYGCKHSFLSLIFIRTYNFESPIQPVFQRQTILSEIKPYKKLIKTTGQNQSVKSAEVELHSSHQVEDKTMNLKMRALEELPIFPGRHPVFQPLFFWEH